MRTRNQLQTIIAVCAAIQPGLAQSSPPKPKYFPAYSVASQVRQIAGALGDRVQAPGKERVVMTGLLSRQGSNFTIQLVREIPGLFRIDETGGNNKSLGFDQNGFRGSSAINSSGEDLAETLDDDTAETFLARFAPGSTVRHLGDAVNSDTKASAGIREADGTGWGENIARSCRTGSRWQ